jgi:hypothetical protein
MRLSELFNDDPFPVSAEERSIREQAVQLWSTRKNLIIKEIKKPSGPTPKTRIVVRKDK